MDAGRNGVSRSVEVRAPTAVLFTIVADPSTTRLDGFGTVRATSAVKPDELLDGSTHRAPLVLGVRRNHADEHTRHRHFRLRDTGPLKDLLKYYERTAFAKHNAAGIEATLIKLRNRYGN